MKDCPDREVLKHLLNNGLLDTQLDALDPHVRSCARCQQALEELTDDALWRSELRHEVTLLFARALPERVIDVLGVTDRASTVVDERTARPMPAVPGYEINAELGRGGMGVVYRARHVRLNRPCALKMILAGAHASPEEVARFVTEAEAIARLEHPSIMQIRHIGEADGLPFLELEYLAGGSLDHQLDGTPWSANRAAQLALRLAQGIAEAHRQGIVHRDLKPSNVLMAVEGTPKVGDFGLAKMLDSQRALTQSESVMGSPSYMAPEQASGHARYAGAAVDVYAVGAILYELLTGRPPYRGKTALETLDQVKTTEPVPPSRLVPGVPRDLETICLKCLQKEPGKRYETALALGEDVQRYLDGRAILARRTSSAERAWRWCRRNRLVAGLAGIAALLILGLTVGTAVAAFTFRAQRDQISADKLRLQIADRQTRTTLLDSHLAQARATRFSRQVGQRFESLRALEAAARIARDLNLPPDRLDRIRDQAIACFALADLDQRGRVIEAPAQSSFFCFDPGMSRYAVRLESGTILVRQVTDDQEIARFDARGNRDVFVFAFSPDGRYLMTTDFPGLALSVWDVDRNTTTLREPGPVARARFSPDSRQLALAHRDGELLLYDLETRQARRLRSGPANVQDLAFRGDGLQIAVTAIETTGRPMCEILEVDSGGGVRTIALAASSRVAWSPDGATLATAGDDFKIDLWDARSGFKRARLEGSTSGGLYVAFHPAGCLLVSTGWEGRLRVWDAVLGLPVLSMTGNNALQPQLSRDGRIALELEGRLTTYQVDPALEYRSLVHVSSEPIDFHRPSIRFDNRLLAVGSTRGVALWDLETGTECAFLAIGFAWHIMFEANGDLLTSAAGGVQRWAVQLDSARNEFRIGPPHELLLGRSGQIAEDRLGRTVAASEAPYTYAKVEVSGRVQRIGPLDEGRYVAVSPDGQWLATGSHHLGAQVWRVRDAQKLAELPVHEASRNVTFSPDGKWLMTAYPPCKLWLTGTWALARELGGTGLSFSPDSRLVAVEDSSKIIRLVEAETGRVIARLESPDSSRVGFATFSPDGSRLVLVPQNYPAVHVWDLRAVRKRLAAMGLDWDAPVIPDLDQASPAALPLPLPRAATDLGPLTNEVEQFTESPAALIDRHTARIKNNPSDAEAYHHRGHALLNRRRTALAIEDLNIALGLRPDDAHLQKTLAQACNNRAWELATGRDSAREAKRAVVLARRAVALAPNEPMYDNTLGVSLYRACEYAEAITTLERNLAASQGEFDGFDLYFLAMAYHRQGQRERSQACFEHAQHWMKSQNVLPTGWGAELAAFRAEAERVLAGPAGELPDQVFTAPLEKPLTTR